MIRVKSMLLSALLLSLCSMAQKVAPDAEAGEVVVEGKIGNIHYPMQLYIYMGEELWDTIPLDYGRFRYVKKTQLPAYGALMLRYNPYIRCNAESGAFFSNMSLVSIFFEDGKMTVNGPVDTLKGYAKTEGTKKGMRHC